MMCVPSPRTRSCTPPPHTRLHGRHSSHLYVQWTGQGKSLQFRCSNLSAAVCVHSRPPCAALTAICLVRFCTPPAPGREHLAHRDQLESLQSTGSGVGAGVGLDVGDAVGDGVGAAGWTTARNPDGARRELEEWLPPSMWATASLDLVGFGQQTCLPRNPLCRTCPVAYLCPASSHNQPALPVRKS